MARFWNPLTLQYEDDGAPGGAPPPPPLQPQAPPPTSLALGGSPAPTAAPLASSLPPPQSTPTPPVSAPGELPLTQEREESQTTTRYSKPTAREAGLQKERRQALDNVAAAEQQAGDARVASAEGQAKVARLAAVTAEEQELRVQLAQQKGLEEYERRRGAYDAEVAKLDKLEPKDFWADKSTGQRVGSAIAVALSGIGQAYQARAGMRTENMAMQVIDKLIAQDRDLQERRFRAQQMRIGAAREGIQDAVQRHQLMQASQAARDAAAWRKVEQLANGFASTTKVAEVQAEAKKIAAQSAERAAAIELQYENGVRKDVTTTVQRLAVSGSATGRGAGAAGGLKGDQATAAANINNLLSQLETIQANPQLKASDLDRVQRNNTLIKIGEKTGPADILGRAVGVIPKSELDGLSPKAKDAWLAWDRAKDQIAAVLSGKGMAEGEIKAKLRQYTPQPGDTDKDIQNKFRAAQQFAKDTMITAGPAAAQIEQRASAIGQPGAGAQAGATRRAFHPQDGKPIMVNMATGEWRYE